MINIIANSTGLHESVYSDCCFDSTAHHSDHAHLAIGDECHQLAPAAFDPITPIAFRFPNSVITVLTLSTGLQRTIKGLFKDVRVPLPNCFFTALVKGMSSGFSQDRWEGLKWQIHCNIPVSLSHSILSYTLNKGKLGIFNSSPWATFDLCFSQPSKLSKSLSYNIKCRVSA